MIFAPQSITLAPMEGVLDHRLRDILTAIGGIDRCVTEFIRISQQTLPARVMEKIYPEVKRGSLTPSRVLVTPQLLGDNEQFMASNAQKLVTLGATSIDINFGCPAKTVNNSGGGSILLQDPEKIYRIVKSIKTHVPPNILVSAKMRLGYKDKCLAIDNAQAIEAGGAHEVTVHARTKVEGYKPPAHYHYIADINEKTNIKVIANGEMWTTQDIQRCIDITGVSDIMLGRGLLACPELALRAKNLTTTPLLWGDICLLLTHYLNELEKDCPEKYQHALIKQWLVYLRFQYGEAHLFFERIKRIKNTRQIRLALQEETREKLASRNQQMAVGLLDLSYLAQ